LLHKKREVYNLLLDESEKSTALVTTFLVQPILFFVGVRNPVSKGGARICTLKRGEVTIKSIVRVGKYIRKDTASAGTTFTSTRRSGEQGAGFSDTFLLRGER